MHHSYILGQQGDILEGSWILCKKIYLEKNLENNHLSRCFIQIKVCIRITNMGKYNVSEIVLFWHKKSQVKLNAIRCSFTHSFINIERAEYPSLLHSQYGGLTRTTPPYQILSRFIVKYTTCAPLSIMSFTVLGCNPVYSHFRHNLQCISIDCF